MMQGSSGRIAVLNSGKVIFSIVLIEYLIFIFSGVSFYFLKGNSFFSIPADPAYWFFYMLRLPQFITSHQYWGAVFDFTILVLLVQIIRNPHRNVIAITLFILLSLYYVTLTGYLTHRNFQSGFLMVCIPFLFKKDLNRQFAFESVRYFLAFFYVSAAFLKLGNLSNTEHLSNLLSGQFTPYFLEGNTGLRTHIHIFLLEHTGITQLLFWSAAAAELSALVLFFTKKHDKTIATVLLLFHFANWFIMDIAPLGQIAFICLLFFTESLRLKR